MESEQSRLVGSAARPRALAIFLAVALLGCRDGAATLHPPAGAGRPQSGIVEQQTATGDRPDPYFADITTEAGLDFVHVNGMRGQHDFVEMMGAGAVLFDFDGDGDLDAYMVQGHPLEPGPIESGQDPAFRGRLYRNDLAAPAGRPRFVDVTEASGMLATVYGMGAAVGDVDNDGRPDLYLANWGPDQLWHNDGNGRFSDVTASAGIDVEGWSSSASFLDFDRDGWLDLYVARYVNFSLDGDIQCRSPKTGDPDYCGPQSFSPTADRLLHNRGDGSFEDVSQSMGIGAVFAAGLGVVTADFDADGWTDLYVANDGLENQQWMNRGGQGFENTAPMSGSAVNQAGKAESSMGVVAEDFDLDGYIDLFLTHIDGETNTYYAGEGQAIFRDRTTATGIGLSTLPFTGFGVAVTDLENDGWLDLVIANGDVVDIYEQRVARDPLPLRQTNQLLHNQRGRFEDRSAEAGPAFERIDVHRALAQGDIDNDGDIDILLSRNNGPASLLENRRGQNAHWLGLALLDADSGRDLLGAEARLERSDGLQLVRRAHSDGGYSSAHDPRLLFGLGASDADVDVLVRWPDGSRESWTGVQVDRYHRLLRGQGEAVDHSERVPRSPSLVRR